MLIQCTLPSLIEAAISFVSDDEKCDLLCDWKSSDKTWQMCPEGKGHSWDGCKEPISSTKEDKENAADSNCVTNSRACFDSSPARNMCASSPPNLVYNRRKKLRSSTTLLLDQATNGTKDNGTKDSVGFLSSMSSKDDHCSSPMQNEIDSAGDPVMTIAICNEHLSKGKGSLFGKVYLRKFDEASCTKVSKRLDVGTVPKSESINGCSGGEEHDSEETAKTKPASDYIVSDTISSSNVELVSASKADRVWRYGTAECSSSFNSLEESLSEKELCISILRSHGLLVGVPPSRGTSTDAQDIDGETKCFQSCKTCGRSEDALKMLICDDCDDAFHMTCFNPRIKKIPGGDWYCQPCSRKKHKSSKESTNRNSVNGKSEATNCRNRTSKSEENPIASMLDDTEEYTTGVRIGKAFQADVPDWSGPLIKDFDCFGEPLEIDPSEHDSSCRWNGTRSFTPKSVGNWLQCREVLDDDTETICGKWRRAPLFEVQTDDWDCSCAVVWDPIHADCAVPQELETEQVLTHLKYVELLRPRLTGRKRKSSPSQSETGR